MLLNFYHKYPSFVPSMSGRCTLFPAQIAVGRKKHTFRDSAERFEKRAQQGQPVTLHICTGARSKQYTAHGVQPYTGHQELVIEKGFAPYTVGKVMVFEKVATHFLDRKTIVQMMKNDGFWSERAFCEWFFGESAGTQGTQVVRKTCIHFTDLRY